jgi:transcriptional regulator with XRE-family HTH domain
MSKELRSPRHDALRRFLKLERQKKEIRQTDLANRLGWKQGSISEIETGIKRVTVLELMSIAKALDFDPCLAIKYLEEVEE